MTRYQFDRERLLTELSDFGIGFQQGKPCAPKKRDWFFIFTVNVFAVAMFMTAAVVVGLVWSRLA